MPDPFRILTFIALALMACGLGGCGTINEKLADRNGRLVPQWLGGLPADAPPRPGTAKYDEFMKERERKRLEPAPPKDAAGQPLIVGAGRRSLSRRRGRSSVPQSMNTTVLRPLRITRSSR